MSVSRPTNNTPQAIFSWFRTVNNKDAIHAYLQELRASDYSTRLNQTDPHHIILHALTTNNIREVNKERLTNAMAAIPVDDIIKLIMLALELILKIIDSTSMCKKPIDKGRAKMEFVDLLKTNTEDNPFINLPHMRLEAADLREVNLKYANLEHAKLNYVRLNNSNLKLANLRHASLNQTDIHGCEMTQADVRWADLSKCIGDFKPEKIDLKSYLQINYQKDLALSKIPTVAELHNTISEINNEIDNERFESHENRVERAMHRHGCHQRVALNIVKLENQINDPKLGFELMIAAAQHPYFAHHTTAKFAKVADHAIMGAHHRFHKNHTRQTPYVGSGSQFVILQAAKRFEDKVRALEAPVNKPVAP